MVPRETKEGLLGQKGVVVWFTGLSGSGKSTVACTLEHALAQRGKLTVLLDGDNVRHGLNSNLGFSAADREENIRRVGEVAKLFAGAVLAHPAGGGGVGGGDCFQGVTAGAAESGLITLTSFISPYRADRDKVRARMAAGDFVEVYMRVPLEVCEQRDPKGLYKAARAGKIKNFTGIDDPYEEPATPEVVVDAADMQGRLLSAEAQAAQILRYLQAHGYLQAPPCLTDSEVQEAAAEA
ncbi:hypothetical protein N2152v2_000522 [Parachlorella kessleri]